MDTFYLIKNETKDTDYAITNRIMRCIESHGKHCILGGADGEIPGEADCVLTVGGDGTLIQAARRLLGRGTPIMGINLGTLGYLTEVEVQNVETAVGQLVSGNFSVEERMLLEGEVDGGERDVALNDIVLARSGSLRIIRFDLYVNGQFLNSYQADGIIVSTPTGSTAYNLSAGGPIVEPTASLMVVTPICSHALGASSIVFSDRDEIRFEIGTRRDGQPDVAAVTFDGADAAQIVTGKQVTIRRAAETVRLIKLSKTSFLATLREKMRGN